MYVKIRLRDWGKIEDSEYLRKMYKEMLSFNFYGLNTFVSTPESVVATTDSDLITVKDFIFYGDIIENVEISKTPFTSFY